MADQSTSIMLKKMGGAVSASSADEPQDDMIFEQNTPSPAPQLKPKDDMEHVLNNILGPSATKQNSPMDD